MTSFSSDGTLGISPEYRQSRIISGCPITAEEEAAIAECRRIYDDPQYRQATAADPPANWVPYWEACRRLEKLRRPAMQAASDQRRADDGVPVTADELAARARVAEIEDTAALPRSAETRAALEQATAAWWAAEREAYEIAGVEYPWDDERDGDELDRRLATLARAKAGLLPLVPAHERTFDDEPNDPVRVPIRASVPMPLIGQGCHPAGATIAEMRGLDQRAASARWLKETAQPLESIPALPPPIIDGLFRAAPGDTHANANRCDRCDMWHGYPFPGACARCGAALPRVQGCELDRIGAGACHRHPNGCPWDGP